MALAAYLALARSVLARCPAFQRCAGQTLDRFVDSGRVVLCAGGEILATRGQPLAYLIVVLSGSLEIGVLTSAGKRFVIRYLEPGQIQGVIPILDGKPSIHDTRAHGESVALLVPKDVFVQALDTDPALALALLRMFCSRSRALYDGAAASALAPMRVRVARSLVSLLPAYGLPRGDVVTLSLKLSQDELAALVGVSRQRLNKELKEFESEGIIAIAYSHIEITDSEALFSIASLDT